MRRRDMLALAGGSLTLAIAGCSSNGGDDGDDGGNQTQDGGGDSNGENGMSGTASFELSGPEPATASADVGATLTVSAELSNTGDASGQTVVEFRIDGETVDSQQVELEADASQDVSFEVSTADLEAGEYTHSIAAGDATVEGTLTLEALDPASFEVSELDPVDASVNLGTTLTVSATVTNTGEQSGEKTVELRLGGSAVASQQLQLDAGASEAVSFEVDTTELEAGEFTHTVATPDSEVSGSLVLEVGEAKVGRLLLNALDAEGVPIEGATVSGENVEGETDAEGRFETELEVGTYDLTVSSGELQATTTVEITADSTTEVIVELLPDTSDLPAIDGFSGSNTGGFISFAEDTESTAREEGLTFEEGDVTIEATVDGNTWESTSTSFAPLETSGVQAQTTAPDGLSGEIDREANTMTAEGTLRVEVEGESFSFQIATTTDVSGALEGAADLGAESGTATLVDNEFTVEDTTGDAIIDSVLGLPIEESGRAWIELIFDLEFQTA